MIAPLIVNLAKNEIGVIEIGTSNKGKRVNEYKAATNLDPKQGWKWCAAFVDFIVMKAIEESRISETKTFKRPKTAAAYGLIEWSLKQDNSTQTKYNPGNDIKPGDIIVYKFSHCGIATSEVKNGYFQAVEGNTEPENGEDNDGGGVFPKKRRTSQVRARIRFTI